MLSCHLLNLVAALPMDLKKKVCGHSVRMVNGSCKIVAKYTASVTYYDYPEHDHLHMYTCYYRTYAEAMRRAMRFCAEAEDRREYRSYAKITQWVRS